MAPVAPEVPFGEVHAPAEPLPGAGGSGVSPDAEAETAPVAGEPTPLRGLLGKVQRVARAADSIVGPGDVEVDGVGAKAITAAVLLAAEALA